ncbi:YCF48-related protein [Pseudomonas sp. C2B4]|uniref:YCF48-related protein n=1 Tax=Pseudomonas sp. C2B4 TaxID=2735270 RepID=UPI001586AA48|nr:YCF48-related protein [Pseudomonas sp. C2B4]NUU35550.1 glycosyl hydrolase [Pseudomonas sp. C2B4]
MFSHRLPSLALALWALAALPAAFVQAPALDYPIAADKVLLLDLEKAGERLVAVGERGVVLYSDDQGQGWHSLRTPVTRTLTAVAFATGQEGAAVGHGGALLHTGDGGLHWQAVEADTGGESLLGVTAMGGKRMVAWGAFGLYLESDDGGASWQRRMILGEDFDRHIAQILNAQGQWLLVGESGTLARSLDQGQTWEAMESPYQGSFFGALQTRDGTLLAYGMRGNLWRSVDQGQSWNKIETATTLAINGSLQQDNGRILALGNGGIVLASDDDGATFRAINGSTKANLAQGVQLSNGQTLAVGDRGVTSLARLVIAKGAKS